MAGLKVKGEGTKNTGSCGEIKNRKTAGGQGTGVREASGESPFNTVMGRIQTTVEASMSGKWRQSLCPLFLE